MEVFSNTTSPGLIEPVRNYLMFNSTDMFVLHILLWYFSQMVAGTVHIDVMERYCCHCNASYIIPWVILKLFMMSLHILHQRKRSSLIMPFISPHKPDHIYILMITQAENILHIKWLSWKDLISIPIVKWFLEMRSLLLA